MVQIKEVVSLQVMVAHDIFVAVVFFCSVFIQHLGQCGLILRLGFLPPCLISICKAKEVLVKGSFCLVAYLSLTCPKQTFILWHVPRLPACISSLAVTSVVSHN